MSPGANPCATARSESLLHRAFEISPFALAFADADDATLGTVLTANKAFTEAIGRPSEEVLGADLLELLQSADPRFERELLVRVAGGDEQMCHVDGRIPDAGWVEFTVWLVPGDGGPGRLLVALRDVTDRRRAALEREIVAVATRVVAQAATVEGAVAAVVPALGRCLGMSFGAAWGIESDDALVCRSAWAADSASSEALLEVTRDLRLPPGVGVPGVAWQRDAAHLATDLAAGNERVRAAVAARDGLIGAVAFPVCVGAERYGVIEFLTDDEEKVDATLTAALDRLGDELAPLLAAKRVHDRGSASRDLLLVEDNAFVARLVGEMLAVSGSDFELVHVETLAAAKERLLVSRPACMLLDLTLPDADGLQGLVAVRSAAPEVPIVVLTGLEDEGMAMRAVQEGAQDYLMKRKVDMHGLHRAIRYAVERKEAEQQTLEHRLRDPLTRLPNRVLFLDRIRVALSRPGRSSVAVLLVNLDRFRVVNHSLGHQSGDRVLVEVAERLQRVAPPGSTLASLGGDEFALLLETADDATLASLAARLVSTLAEPFTVEEEPITFTATVGIAVDRSGRIEPAELVRQADTALSRGKEVGGDRFEIFEEGVRERLRERLALERGLRDALDADEIRTFYQPIVDLASRRIVAFEALIRWEHPEQGMMFPGDFIPVAEESGLIVPLGARVLDDALRQLAVWADPRLAVSVNLSARQLADEQLVSTVRAALERHGIGSDRLWLEVTETGLIEDFDASLQRLGELKAMGVKLALDDFGTGYSSLSYLQRLPVDVLKLDRSFVAAMRDGEGSALVGAVARMAAAIGLSAVAEGAEHEEELDVLAGLDYGLAQGYVFSRPVPAEEATSLLRDLSGGRS